VHRDARACILGASLTNKLTVIIVNPVYPRHRVRKIKGCVSRFACNMANETLPGVEILLAFAPCTECRSRQSARDGIIRLRISSRRTNLTETSSGAERGHFSFHRANPLPRRGEISRFPHLAGNSAPNDLERFRERAITAFVPLPAPPSRHVSLGWPRKRAGKLPERVPARNEGPQTCSTSSHNTWTGGRLSHMARARRTLRQRLPPPPPPGVKLNFGYTGCAKCLSRRWDALRSRARARACSRKNTLVFSKDR